MIMCICSKYARPSINATGGWERRTGLLYTLHTTHYTLHTTDHATRAFKLTSGSAPVITTHLLTLSPASNRHATSNLPIPWYQLMFRLCLIRLHITPMRDTKQDTSQVSPTLDIRTLSYPHNLLLPKPLFSLSSHTPLSGLCSGLCFSKAKQSIGLSFLLR